MSITLTPDKVVPTLRQIRQAKKMTMKQLGKLTFETEANISYRERGFTGVTLTNIERWARGLGYEVAIVLTEVQE